MNARALQAANRTKTYFLLAVFGVLAWVVIYAGLTYFGSSTTNILPIAIGFALITTWSSYYFSDRMVLTMTGAKIIQESDNPNLFALVREVCAESNLPMPKVAVVNDPFDGLLVIVFVTIYQQIENYLFTPRVSSLTMDIHPAVAFASVIVFASFFGPVGALIGVPIAAAVIALIQTYGKRYELIPELHYLQNKEDN